MQTKQQSTKTGRPSKTPKRTPPPSAKLIQKLQLPECSMMYAHALVDPFEAEEGACIPAELFPLPSNKAKNFIRGQLALGTSGVGFVCCNPVIANDSTCCTSTTATSVGTSATAYSAFTNVTSSVFAPISFATAALTAGTVQGRVVAYGIHAKYVGSLMNRNGVVVSYEDPDHLNLASKTHDQLSANQYSSVDRVGDDKWDAAVCYSGPASPSDVEFLGSAQPISPNSLGIAILSIKGVAGDIYEWEFYEHYEHIGSVVNSRTKSHSEPQITGKTIEAAKSLTAHAPLKPQDKGSFFSKVFEGVSETLPQLISGGKAVMNMVTGNFGGAISEGLKFINTPAGRMLLGSTGGLTQGMHPSKPQTQLHRELAAQLHAENRALGLYN